MAKVLGYLFFGALAAVLMLLGVGLYTMTPDEPETDKTTALNAVVKPTASGLGDDARKGFTRSGTTGRDRFRKVKTPTTAPPPAPEDKDVARSWFETKIDRYTRTHPPAYYLWRDGYQVGPDLTVWGDKNREALAAYLRDWGLPAEEPDPDGWLSPALMSRLDRSDRVTKPQWVTVKIPACKVWIADLMPGEKTTWKGVCHGRTAGGEGVLTREFIRQGRKYKIGFTGTLLDGKADGYGQTDTVRGLTYVGTHIKGLFDGEGVLFDTRTGDEIYRGEFKEGFPHGDGQHMTAAGPVKGSWEMGCFDGGKQTIALLRHPSECKAASSPFSGAFGGIFD